METMLAQPEAIRRAWPRRPAADPHRGPLRRPTPAGSVHALSRIALDIAEGEFVCVVGPSGCGKSTLLRILAGLDDFDTGTAALDGRGITGPSRDVGVVFQAANLLPWLTVRENVKLPLRVGGRQRGEAEDVDRLLNVAGLADFSERYPYELSGGMQQRAGICRALVRSPRVPPDGRALRRPRRPHPRTHEPRAPAHLAGQRQDRAAHHPLDLRSHLLADRVIIMSARPGRVIRELRVGIPRPRSNDTIISHPGLCAAGQGDPRPADRTGRGTDEPGHPSAPPPTATASVGIEIAGRKPRPRPRPRRGLNGSVIGLIGLVLLFAAWDISVRVLQVPSYILPAPLAVWRALWSGLAVSPSSPLGYYLPLWGTLKNAAIGLCVGAGAGLVLGSVMAESRTFEKLLIALRLRPAEPPQGRHRPADRHLVRLRRRLQGRHLRPARPSSPC